VKRTLGLPTAVSSGPRMPDNAFPLLVSGY
jgi:hypothetical protein